MDIVRVDDKVTINNTGKTAVVAWIDDSKDHDNYLLEIVDSEEMPKFYNREDFEPFKKDKLVGLDQTLKDKQEEIAVKQLSRKLKSSGFAKDEINLIISYFKKSDNYMACILDLLQYFKDKSNDRTKEGIAKEIKSIINNIMES